VPKTKKILESAPRLRTPWQLWEQSSLRFQAGELAFVCGRAGHGKSALLLNLLWSALQQGGPAKVLTFSLEMSPAQMALRLAALADSQAGHAKPLSYREMQAPEAGQAQRVQAACAQVAKASGKWVCQYLPMAKPQDLARQAMALAKRSPLQAIMVDPAVFLGTPALDAARHLKALAVQLQVPVLASLPMRRITPQEDGQQLRQLLSQGVEYNDGEVGDAIRRRRPRLEHLPDPALMQEADLVLSLLSHLADYNEEQDPDNHLVFPQRHVGPLEIAALKHRFGSLEAMALSMDDRSGRITD
jgi:replicative DNA helicase